jgi:glycosyltransferase involved in cell wall biosynthesis
MPKVSVNILTKNRAELLKKALASVLAQTFSDYEVIVVDDGSSDGTQAVLKDLKLKDLKIFIHTSSLGITLSRQEALQASQGEYVAILDDDDVWSSLDKLKKQVEFLNSHQDYVLIGGAISIGDGKTKSRPLQNHQIKKTMLFRNNFFTSTVMFSRQAAIEAGAFIKDDLDLGEDYDLWLRMGKLGKMANLSEVLAVYSQPDYNKDKFQSFLHKQLRLIKGEKSIYPYYQIAKIILNLRLQL